MKVLCPLRFVQNFVSCLSTGKKINLGDEERPRGAGAAAEEAEGRGDRRSDERNLPDQVTEALRGIRTLQ